MKLLKVTAVHVISLIFATVNQVFSFSCLDSTGTAVDWFVLFKLPNSYSYSFFTSKSATWNSNSKTDIRTNGPVFQTLAQSYDIRSKTGNLVVFYNNDAPTIPADNSSFAHMKGVLTYNTRGNGFWMIHSVSKFPSIKAYDYPKGGKAFGQMFMCVSSSHNRLEAIGFQLHLAHPNIYHFFADSEFIRSSLYWKLLKQKRKPKPSAPTNNTVVITSVGGVKFFHSVKRATFEKDLYADLIAPYFKVNLLVESWSDSRGHPLRSYCKKYKVENVRKFMSLPGRKPASSTSDHSKWAIANSATSEVDLVCVGDINRMASQFFRAGGTFCFFNASAHSNLQKTIVAVESCSKGTSISTKLKNVYLHHVFHPYGSPYFVHYFPSYHIRIRVFYWMLTTILITLLFAAVFAVCLQVRRRKQTIYYRTL